MEDYHVAEYRKKKNHELGLFAIFDGHLGDRVPTYLKDNLFNNILEEVPNSQLSPHPVYLFLFVLFYICQLCLCLMQPNFWKNPETAIKNAYLSTDDFILQNSMQLGPGGSTAVTAIIIDGKDLWVANIGDSRAVICERGSANQLTVDHEPHSERTRIEEQGGFVTTLPGKYIWRLLFEPNFITFFFTLLLSPHYVMNTYEVGIFPFTCFPYCFKYSGI